MLKEESRDEKTLKLKNTYQQKLQSFTDRASTQRSDLINQSQDLLAAATLYARQPDGYAAVQADLLHYSDNPGYILLVEVLQASLDARVEAK